MTIGRSIRIYLSDGSVSGIRHAEIVNWTGQAISAPRISIKELKDWGESLKPGVYFLFGVDEETSDDAVYIGEAENVFNRLSSHIANKDFWNEVIFFTNKDENLTKSHVKYLESRLCDLTSKAGRYTLTNGNEPQVSVLPRGDRDAMEEFIDNIKTLLGVMGHRVLESYTESPGNSPTEPEQHNAEALPLFLDIKKITAKALRTDEGIVVLSGSHAKRSATKSLAKGPREARDALIAKSVLVPEGDHFMFSKDHLFTSPSQAAAVIMGYPVSGPQYWKTKDGTTLKEIEEALPII